MKIIIPILVILQFACSENKLSNGNSYLQSSFKITITSDTCDDGTKYQYILANDTYQLIYLKDKYTIQDTIIDEHQIKMDDTLEEILDLAYETLKYTTSPTNNCGATFKVSINNNSKSVIIDENNPQDIVCKTISYINSFVSEKYKLELCDKN